MGLVPSRDIRPRSFTIFGGGQSGLVLAIGLRRAGHQVCVVQERPASARAAGHVMSSRVHFAVARDQERALGLDLWPGQAPQIHTMRIEGVLSANDKLEDFVFDGPLGRPVESIDLRVKFPAWLHLFGTLEINHIDPSRLDAYARDGELEAIRNHNERHSDDSGIQKLPVKVWKCVRASTFWTSLKFGPPTMPMVELLRRARFSQTMADRYVHGFDKPETIMSPLLGMAPP
jgi:hypothetical protein